MAIRKYSITDSVINRPIIFAFLFIFAFELFIQYEPRAFLMVLAIYFVLKGLGLTYYVKFFFDFFYDKIMVKLDTKQIHIVDEDSFGNVYGIFTFSKGFKKYMLKVNTANDECILNLFVYEDSENTKKLTTIITKQFPIEKEAAIHKIMDLYFNNKSF